MYRQSGRQFLTNIFHIAFIIGQFVSGQGTSPTDQEPRYLKELFEKFTPSQRINQSQLNVLLSDLNLLPDHHIHHDHEQEDHLHCYTAKELLNISGESGGLTRQGLHKILPTVVYEIVSDACHHEEHEETKSLGWKVITAAVAAVLVISASGLIVVALLPLMPANFYNVVTQFLIALSVGSLIGDAFLHLIPHALSGEHAHEHGNSHAKQEHLRMISLALVAVLGVYVFFLTERLTILYQNKSSKRKVKREPVYVTDEVTISKDGGDLTVENVSNGRPNGIRATDTAQNRSPRLMHANWGSDYQKVGNAPATQWSSPVDGLSGSEFVSPCDDNPLCNRPPLRPLDNARCEDHLRGFLESETEQSLSRRNDTTEGAAQLLCTPHEIDLSDETNKKIEKKNSPDYKDRRNTSPTVGSMSHSAQVNFECTPTGTRSPTTSPLEQEEEDRKQPTHLHRDRPHGHHHGHSHDLSSISAIAYTVIAGDGLHNFCDGIAIGAAFANSLEGGLSTAIAVLCHELPHEVGDFAVLLHAGISVKSAMLCNLLSSILCACGTAIGLSVGRINSVDSWLFMLTAGMFVYIALVDMMPELATSRLKGHRTCHRPSLLFMWQNLGLVLGCAVMLMIALFEAQVI